MAKQLHPKIQALRNSVGYKPIYEFLPNRKKYDAVKKEVRSPSFSDDNPRLIKQYFCIWGIPDDYGTQPEEGCFKKSIKERGPNTDATNKILVLNQHRQCDPLCIPNILKEDETGLYGEYEPDEGIDSNDDLVKRVMKGTINNGSYGFHYVWDKMVYDEKKDIIHMYETELFEVSPVTFGSQGGTYVVRSKDQIDADLKLEQETEAFIRKMPKDKQMEMRSLLTRYISLAQSQPDERSKKPLQNRKPKKRVLDFSYIADNLNF